MKILVIFTLIIGIFIAVSQIEARCKPKETYCQRQCRRNCYASQHGKPRPPPETPGKFCHCPFCGARPPKPDCGVICKKACDAAKQGIVLAAATKIKGPVCSCPACIID